MVANTVFPPSLLVSLLLVLGASSVVTWALIRRITTQRSWLDLSEWAGSNSFGIVRGRGATVPASLIPTLPSPRGLLMLTDAHTTIVQLETTSGGAASTRWNVLVRRTTLEWPRTGLRPSGSRGSLLDLYPLTPFPNLIPAARYVVVGDDFSAAFALAGSAVRGLIPADVGLLLDGDTLVLDFSARPFDPLEMHRMTALAEQLVAHLPSPALRS
jgi:hypothetical protein